MDRRSFLHMAAVAAAATPAASRAAVEGSPSPVHRDTVPGPTVRKRAPLAPIRASMDRIISVEACLRPFRPQGPRIEAERQGRKVIVHNYGHGGSGWSLSWGSARLAVNLARKSAERRLAVIGCGAIGLTSAIVAQRAGLRVRIYAREQVPFVRSSRATGVWSPGSRFCTLEHATPELRRSWEEMARYSYFVYSSMLGLPGNPIEWTEGYKISDHPFAAGTSLYTHAPFPGEPVYPRLEDDHTPDLMSALQPLSRDEHPFPVEHVGRVNMMMFNIPTYARMLMQEFLASGGEFVQKVFEHPRQFQDLPEKTIIHSTGYAARALLGDNSLVPVRGQTARLIPQPEVDYAISYDSQNVYTVPRRDGIIVQEWSPGDYGNDKEAPYLEATRTSVEKIRRLCEQMGKGPPRPAS